MLTERPLYYKLLFEAGNCLRMVWSGQLVTWIKSMKALNSGPAHVVAVSLAGWDPQDLPKRWLDTIDDTV